MPESYLKLSGEDRLEALGVAATESGRPTYLLEKDIWVVWALEAVFGSSLGEHLVFKGGTSLSKAYGVIQRFSEDIDLTYDVRQLIPELAKGTDPVPPTKSQAKKWTDAVREKLDVWVREKALPVLQAHAEKTGVKVKLSVEGSKIHINYDALTEHPAYSPPRITLEFGARSTGEPAEAKPIVCDAAQQVTALTFPTATARTMLPKRTFWEKATAVHAFNGGHLKGHRNSRHWHDLVRLDERGFAKEALADTALAEKVADWKTVFFPEKDKNGNPVDYKAAVAGKLQLVPDAKGKIELKADYEKMVEAGLLFDDAESFDDLMKRCADIEKRANSR
jgi:hypothetical protein